MSKKWRFWISIKNLLPTKLGSSHHSGFIVHICVYKIPHRDIGRKTAFCCQGWNSILNLGFEPTRKTGFSKITATGRIFGKILLRHFLSAVSRRIDWRIAGVNPTNPDIDNSHFVIFMFLSPQRRVACSNQPMARYTFVRRSWKFLGVSLEPYGRFLATLQKIWENLFTVFWYTLRRKCS